MTSELTEDQKKFLAECEAEFSNRYTDQDKDFLQVKQAGIGQPPIVYPWFSKDRSGDGRNRGWGGGGGGRDNYHNNKRSYQDRHRNHEDHRRDRGYHGNENYSGHNSRDRH